MANKDGRTVARENELRVMRALHRFGWLRTRDLAAIVCQRWVRNPAGEPNLAPSTPTAAGLRMAQRTLSRLRGKRLVLSSRAPDGSLIHWPKPAPELCSKSAWLRQPARTWCATSAAAITGTAAPPMQLRSVPSSQATAYRPRGRLPKACGWGVSKASPARSRMC